MWIRHNIIISIPWAEQSRARLIKPFELNSWVPITAAWFHQITEIIIHVPFIISSGYRGLSPVHRCINEDRLIRVGHSSSVCSGPAASVDWITDCSGTWEIMLELRRRKQQHIKGQERAWSERDRDRVSTRRQRYKSGDMQRDIWTHWRNLCTALFLGWLELQSSESHYSHSLIITCFGSGLLLLWCYGLVYNYIAEPVSHIEWTTFCCVYSALTE